MIEKLPYYYRKSKVVADLYEVIEKILDESERHIKSEDLKLFITTTSDFVLHERDVGLADISADMETKRSRVIARIQGNSLLTKAELEKLIMLYDKTGCSISEDFANYAVTILFNGRTGKPSNIEQIISAVEELKPAHLQFNYEFVKNTWNDAKNKIGTWKTALAFTWNGMQSYDGRTWIYIDNNTAYLQENNANAYVILKNGVPYAHLI